MGFEGEGASRTAAAMPITQAVRSLGYADITDFARAYDAMDHATRDIVADLLLTLLDPAAAE